MTMMQARAEIIGLSDELAEGGWFHQCTSGSRWFLCVFIHRLLDFRITDVESVVESLGCPLDALKWRLPHGNEQLSPFWYIRLPEECMAKQLADRAMLTRGFMEVWGEGSTWEELQTSIESCPPSIIAPWLQEDVRFKIVVEAYGWKMGEEKHRESIRKLHFIPFKGKVDVKNPAVKLWLILCRASENSGIPDTVPDRMYFGREVACSDRSRIDAHSLRSRSYIGPTSMDCEMAFIMANMGKVRKGSLVLDPYAGTGSILVAAAALGAQVVGADIDIRVIKLGKVDAQGQQLDVYSNFDQYGLTPLLAGLLRMDAHRHALRPGLEEMFHAIIGDPPYGVRAGGRKSVSKPDVVIRDLDTHVPSTDPYALSECLRDLLDLAARLLVLGGRLVFFFPSASATYREEEVPLHPALRIISNTEQILSTRYSRRLVTMEKVGRYDAAAAEAHHAEAGEPSLSIDTLRDAVYAAADAAEGKLPRDPLSGKRYRGKMV